MKKFKARYRKWKSWRRFNGNGWFYQILVLFGIVISPTFESWVDWFIFEKENKNV